MPSRSGPSSTDLVIWLVPRDQLTGIAVDRAMLSRRVRASFASETTRRLASRSFRITAARVRPGA